MPNKGAQPNKKEMEAVKIRLLSRRDELVHKLSQFRNESKEVGSDVAQDLADKAESSYTKEFLLSLSDAERDELFQIDAALKRAASGGYGHCLMCQKEISKKRLAALPWTPLCIECEEKSEIESA
jgi:DnaK suppressor protein